MPMAHRKNHRILYLCRRIKGRTGADSPATIKSFHNGKQKRSQNQVYGMPHERSAVEVRDADGASAMPVSGTRIQGHGAVSRLRQEERRNGDAVHAGRRKNDGYPSVMLHPVRGHPSGQCHRHLQASNGGGKGSGKVV